MAALELGKQAKVVKQLILVERHENYGFYFGFGARFRVPGCSRGRMDDVRGAKIRDDTSDSQSSIQCTSRKII
jgi:hypothetical protein